MVDITMLNVLNKEKKNEKSIYNFSVITPHYSYSFLSIIHRISSQS